MVENLYRQFVYTSGHISCLVMILGWTVKLDKKVYENNDKISYIPTFNDLYSEEIEEQIYASIITAENMKIREALQSQVRSRLDQI